jgi:hypothetical protein
MKQTKSFIHTDTSRREKRRDTSTTSTKSLSEGTLRTKLDSDFTSQVIFLEYLIVAQVRKDQTAQLAILR